MIRPCAILTRVNGRMSRSGLSAWRNQRVESVSTRILPRATRLRTRGNDSRSSLPVSDGQPSGSLQQTGALRAQKRTWRRPGRPSREWSLLRKCGLPRTGQAEGFGPLHFPPALGWAVCARLGIDVVRSVMPRRLDAKRMQRLSRELARIVIEVGEAFPQQPTRSAAAFNERLDKASPAE